MALSAIQDAERSLQAKLQRLLEAGKMKQAKRAYLSADGLQSAKTHHLGAIAARETKDIGMFMQAQERAWDCADIDNDIKADFYRDRALLMLGIDPDEVNEALCQMQTHRVPTSVDEVIDLIARAKVNLARGMYNAACINLNEAHGNFYMYPAEVIDKYPQVWRDILWWRMLAMGLCLHTRHNSFELARNIFWGATISDPKPKRRVISLMLMLTPDESLQRALIKKLVQHA